MSLICQLTSEDIKHQLIITAASSFPQCPCSSRSSLVIVRAAAYASDSGESPTCLDFGHCFLVGPNKSYVVATSDLIVTLHPCFQPASLTPHPAPLHYELKQNEAQSACIPSTNKGVNQRSKDATQTQQQTWHASKYRVHKLHNFTRLPGESYRGRLRSLLLCLNEVFQALINSLVC